MSSISLDPDHSGKEAVRKHCVKHEEAGDSHPHETGESQLRCNARPVQSPGIQRPRNEVCHGNHANDSKSYPVGARLGRAEALAREIFIECHERV
jgi:hypothetical protein